MKMEDVTHRTVCEYLLTGSKAKDDFSALCDEDFDRYMKDFATKHRGNPALVWLGYDPKDKRRPVKWKRATGIDVKTLCSHGLNSEWNDALKSVSGNLYRFFMECEAVHGQKEYRLDELPSDELSFIIGVVDPRTPSKIELIDGSHRLASMIFVKQVQTVNGYVGY